MQLEHLLEQMPEFDQILGKINAHERQLITGISGSARTLLLSALTKKLTHPQIIVTDSLFHMDQVAADLMNRLPEAKVLEFPAEEMIAAEVATSSPNYRLQRVQALHALIADENCIIVTSTSGVNRLLPAPTVFEQAVINVKVGGELDPEQTKILLSSMGYRHEKMVLRPGDFAVRGSIIDIYPLNTDYPVRIDLFDTEIDSLRYFDASDQRSVKNIDQVSILPATDFVVAPADFESIEARLQAEFKKAQGKLSDDNASTHLEQSISPLLKALAHQQLVPEMLELANLVYPEKNSILDYLSPEGGLFIDDYPRIVDAQKQLQTDESNWLTDKVEQQQLFSTASLGNDFTNQIRTDKHAQVLFALFQKGLGQLRFSQLTNLITRNMQQFFGQLPILKTEIQRWNKQKQTVVIMVNGQDRMQKINSTLHDFGIAVTETKPDDIQPKTVQLIAAGLQNGFEFPGANLVVITEAEMFKQVKKKRVRQQTLANAERIKSYTDLKPGDYVVHVNHGIGQFTGIQTLEVDGVKQDYMTIDYQKNAQIFVPITQLNLVQKYVSSEAKTPHINKLGGSEWAKTKRKVAAKIEDIADELVELYAAREAEKGYAYPKDDNYQDQFEGDFPYTETRDQLRSSEEIKKDMERIKPMDRLLVGDVGYGKTEVALRAAFKAIEAGKQVAFLVPTTILAQQHYDTMQNRFEGYPVNIGLMSRFRTTKQVHETEDDLRSGKCDIVVGTHRLLSKDIKFKDLGLLIIDEEQRFGVKHKEKLKQLKSNVDVLTLTATPIPRTLHMSMLGVRDLSVIETPPAGRFPIQTYVMEQNAGALRDGIMREMQRGGQVYYLHNRVADIEKTVSEIQTLVPEARVGYIHGQMNESQLEGVLYDFVRGEYDVLVTTSIIETGVDIPNVNTLFVENADRMGLAQLYQIRGRIGRSNRVAYAYFMYQANKVLTEVSEKRLAAIRDFTELGSGFKIAMRDLSIRGAGNLLGKQQHGFIDSVGYDLYSQMLADAVAQKQGKQVAEKSDSEIELGVEAYLPTDYIEDQRQKIEIYKEIRKAENEDQLVETQGDLIDRFGDYPVQVGNLLIIGKIKLFSDLALLQKVRKQNDLIFISLSKRASEIVAPKIILQQLAKTDFKSTIGETEQKLQIKLVIQPKMSQSTWLAQLTDFVGSLAQAVHDSEDKREAKVTSS
ncbi:Transcription-repair coupling factor [Paucilactobacillus wasatchensis]|uniref:Transcription-repair-coupling factor n=2 Tax=Paucilactobacillus wasatchensis TaxID=1335616 RepID=A0A0D1A8N8_9LACO|nr:Transcription-repair coupling factor [Paucilactobacillus wasatchensis]